MVTDKWCEGTGKGHRMVATLLNDAVGEQEEKRGREERDAVSGFPNMVNSHRDERKTRLMV